MKASAVAFATVAAAGAVQPRQDSKAGGLASQIRNIDSAVKSVSAAAAAYKGGDPSAALAVGSSLVAAIAAGQSYANGITQTLGLQAALLTVSNPVKTLGSDGQALASILIGDGVKAQVEAAGACSDVNSLVQEVFTGGINLASYIVTKVIASEARDIATGLAAPLTSALSSASSAYANDCKNSGGGGNTSRRSGSSTSEPASESTSEPTSTGGSGGDAPTYVPPGSSNTGGSSEPTSTPPAEGNPPSEGNPPPTAGAGIIAPVGALVMGVVAMLAL